MKPFGALAILLMTHMPLVQAADAYPSRPVRMIIPGGAGGITDILGRAVAAAATDPDMTARITREFIERRA